MSPRQRDTARGTDGLRDAHLDTLEVLLQILPVAQAVAQRVWGRGLHVFVHATGRGEPRVGRTELQPRPARGASATAPVRFRARAAAAANGKGPGVISARAPPLGAANRSPGRELGVAVCPQGVSRFCNRTCAPAILPARPASSDHSQTKATRASNTLFLFF